MLATAHQIPLVQQDPWLEPFGHHIAERLYRFRGMMALIEETSGSLLAFANLHTYLGLNRDEQRGGWVYREWAPSASALYLTGTFNQWDRRSHPLTQLPDRAWEIFLSDAGTTPLLNGQQYKVVVQTREGEFDRIPAMARYVVQDETTKGFSPVVFHPEVPYVFKHERPAPLENPCIYEAHTGMAGEEPRVHTYCEFADTVLPRVRRLGYDTVQLMAVQEHPYYGSYGYHVSSLFAPSSRFGTPDDLKYLVDTAHGMGLRVIMDLVHSHAVKNFYEGLDRFDGTDAQYFHQGGRGNHELWDSKLYNYGRQEVVQFLLSNVRYWLEEFKFDGYRFDGITSMLYHHHGLGKDFLTYADYFNENTHAEAVLYLQLANEVAHATYDGALTVAEDMSGMPGLGRPVSEGGIGFDMRLGMGLPDYWIKLIKEVPDEHWDVESIYWQLLNRRNDEKTIAYVESHDQALVGDQTLAFRLMGAEMYTAMNRGSKSLAVDRGVALHKMIRLITLALGGEGWLTFMGNEFGHPEWIDFPREGNGWSYAYARRQWHLAQSPFLRYSQLESWDQAIIRLAKDAGLLAKQESVLLNADPQNQTICFYKASLVFVFNFHATSAIDGYALWVPEPGKYELMLSSDEDAFGGFARTNSGSVHFTDAETGKIKIYNLPRVCQVFKRVS